MASPPNITTIHGIMHCMHQGIPWVGLGFSIPLTLFMGVSTAPKPSRGINRLCDFSPLRLIGRQILFIKSLRTALQDDW